MQLRIVIASMLFATGAAHAEPRWHLSAELDPLAYIMEGYSIHVHVRAPDSHWRFGAAAFGSGNDTLPPFLRDTLFTLNGSKDKNTGWNVGVNEWAVEAFYDFSPGESSPYLGAHLIDVRGFASADDGSHMTSQQLALLPAAGYRWYPQHGVFLAAWAGLGGLTPELTKHETGPRHFATQYIYPLATIHLGVEL